MKNIRKMFAPSDQLMPLPCPAVVNYQPVYKYVCEALFCEYDFLDGKELSRLGLSPSSYLLQMEKRVLSLERSVDFPEGMKIIRTPLMLSSITPQPLSTCD